MEGYVSSAVPGSGAHITPGLLTAPSDIEVVMKSFGNRPGQPGAAQRDTAALTRIPPAPAWPPARTQTIPRKPGRQAQGINWNRNRPGTAPGGGTCQRSIPESAQDPSPGPITPEETAGRRRYSWTRHRTLADAKHLFADREPGGT